MPKKPPRGLTINELRLNAAQDAIRRRASGDNVSGDLVRLAWTVTKIAFRIASIPVRLVIRARRRRQNADELHRYLRGDDA
ncbi:MAG: hypothetical protein CL694_14550 [Chloroflexi bacterium]|jgi:hypothetical protein|nr:hypothetical protein [Chloroflexota bacterium]MDP6421390.1 hypothetical protein [SAR202 cluster bacterium]MDP6665039.1 hypothetical protein [SAR202 cluster bacterium]MDP6801300.1 hypothetical protein [SAR202 cluster bacterium]MQG56735.1 hypothetical protein [SAR202 cluster bacterium]|tara:strand:- start:240 stop:482 length:243 start_codon:yes stop_codon:yes gene_type:complete